ncbi:subtype B tannase [Streptomyces sp. NBC_01465]|uniref:subtype B tannase n=1 Tax=Streptomyces sp. NBC_01465 TaxID=2903878 RepID=UPI002E3284AC|nr:subtype B tannase [Streptomyces sp. NBC_01465]
MGIGATAGVAAIGTGVGWQASAEGASGTLVFDRTAYKTVTETITTDAGDKEVEYHFYGPITYVTNPSDDTHQSLVVSVPVKIDGKTVDATDAPIVFANGIGGYFPSSVATATGVGQSTMEMGGGGAPGGGTGPGGGGGGGGGAKQISMPKLGLAAGYVVVEPGARGRSLTDSSGVYYGTAPAAIVDLKAAVRYVRANKGRIPGNTDRIVSTGVSAGGALSSLLGASGDSKIYESYLKEAGAAHAGDAIFAVGAWCPITDLEHADAAYEFCWGDSKTQPTGAVVDQTVAKALQSQFAEHQASLKLPGLHHFGRLTARNYDEYLVKTYMQPAATKYLAALSDADRTTYLAANTFITWSGSKATFTWSDYVTHVGARKKTTPAFDAFDLSAGENNEYGLGTTSARHFTQYALDNDTTGLTSKRLASDIPEKLRLMNPMHHLAQKNPGRSKHWWIRVGTNDTDSSPVIVANLAAAAADLGDDVSSLMYWDGAHGANDDAADFITWIAKVTGHKRK